MSLHELDQIEDRSHEQADAEGIVYKKLLGSYIVHTGKKQVSCVLSSKLHKNLEGWFGESQSTNIRRKVKKVHKIRQVDPVAVGDRVRYVDAGDGSGMIVEVLPRHNQLSRHQAIDSSKRIEHHKRLEQVIVANVDQVIPVFAAARPAPKWNLLDRYLVSAETSRIPAVICVTKMDLVGADDEALAELKLYEQIGYPVVYTSSQEGTGIDQLVDILKGKTSVFIGKSGVGKTSLLNAVQPGLGQKVNEVSSATDKGKHTTTHLEMFPLSFDGAVVDTPGMREFGLFDRSVDFAELFPEMRPLIGSCRFGLNCRHVNEPDCAIKGAVEIGEISERRYRSFLSVGK